MGRCSSVSGDDLSMGDIRSQMRKAWAWSPSASVWRVVSWSARLCRGALCREAYVRSGEAREGAGARLGWVAVGRVIGWNGHVRSRRGGDKSRGEAATCRPRRAYRASVAVWWVSGSSSLLVRSNSSMGTDGARRRAGGGSGGSGEEACWWGLGGGRWAS